jgi:hypothetical protein
MNPLIPTPETIPVSWVCLKSLLMIVFPLHLLFMNAMLGSTVIALYTGLINDRASRELSRRLAGIIPYLVAFAVNLGVAAFLFIQVLYGQFFYTSSILMAAFWLAVIPLLMTAYYLLYLYDFRFDSLGNARVIAVAVAVLIFLSIAFIYSNNMTLMLAPQRWSAYFTNPAGTLLNLAEPALWPRYLHFMIGGSAIGALFVALYGKYLVRRDHETGDLAVTIGMRVFALLTMIQVVDGLWFLQSIPGGAQKDFMGGDTPSTVLFFVAVMLVLAVIMAVAVKSVYTAAGLVVPLVYVMAFLRDHLRSAYLRPYFSPDSVAVVPQYSPMIMFLCILAAGVSVVAWMLFKGARCRG